MHIWPVNVAVLAAVVAEVVTNRPGGRNCLDLVVEVETYVIHVRVCVFSSLATSRLSRGVKGQRAPQRRPLTLAEVLSPPLSSLISSLLLISFF